MALSPDGERLYVQHYLSRAVSVFAVGPLLAGMGSMRWLGEVGTVGEEALAPEILRGKQIFYNAENERMNKDAYFSCGGCHLDGGQDGRVWDFTHAGEGLRNTIILNGVGGTAQGRLHWTGNFDEVQDFENQIRSWPAGRGFMTDADFGRTTHPLAAPKAGRSRDLDALAAYVESLAAYDPSPYDFDRPYAAAAGAALFRRRGCADCHGGPSFTSSERGLLHDVGTLGAASGRRLGGMQWGLDVPTLRGVWQTAPYGHDGGAAELEELFLNDPDGRHFGRPALTAGEAHRLAAYLRTLDGSNPAPVAGRELTVVGPTPGQRTSAGEAVSLDIATNFRAMDEVRYFVGDRVVAVSDASPWAATWWPSDTGRYEVRAQVVHGTGGTTTTSMPVAVYVGSAEAGLRFLDAPKSLTARTANWTAAPNPGDDQLRLRNVASFAGPVEVAVLDVSGRRWLRRAFTAGEQPNLAVAALRPGVYVLVIRSAGRRSTLRWVKR